MHMALDIMHNHYKRMSQLTSHRLDNFPIKIGVINVKIFYAKYIHYTQLVNEQHDLHEHGTEGTGYEIRLGFYARYRFRFRYR